MNRQHLTAVIASTCLLLACSDDGGSNPISNTGSQQAASDMVTVAEVSPVQQAGPADSDDPITAGCIAILHKQQGLCECATGKFRAENEQADVYAALTAYYLDNTDEQKPLADRWQEAVDVVLADYSGKSTPLERRTENLQLNNALGRAHREAIKACSG